MESTAAPAERSPERPALAKSVWLRIALALAAVEAVLVVVGAIPRWAALGAALAVVAAYLLRGHRLPARPRAGAWALAVSQALVLLVPLAVWIADALVVLVLAALAVAVLIVLLVRR
jgi:hypothetical protein